MLNVGFRKASYLIIPFCNNRFTHLGIVVLLTVNYCWSWNWELAIILHASMKGFREHVFLHSNCLPRIRIFLVNFTLFVELYVDTRMFLDIDNSSGARFTYISVNHEVLCVLGPNPVRFNMSANAIH